MCANPIHRTIDGKKYYVRLVTLLGKYDTWTTMTDTRYFATAAKCEQYIAQRLASGFTVNPDNGTLTQDRRHA